MSEFKKELADFSKELLISDADGYEFSTTPIRSNTLQIFLYKETFNDDEAVKGSILITITDTFQPKRLIISILGELNSQESLTNRSHKNTKKGNQLVSGEEKEFVREFSKSGSRSNISKTPTFSRTLTFKSKKPLSRFGTSNSIKNNAGPDDSVRSSREVFVHYNIPVFTFKTAKLPPGKYKFPFQFALSPQIMASFQYNENGFQLAISYFITASLEEDRDAGEEEDMIVSHLKSRRELKIVKNKKNFEDAPSSRTNIIEVSERIRVPSLLCFKYTDQRIILRLDKAVYKVGEMIKFEIEFPNIKLAESAYKIRVHLLQAMANSGESKSKKILLRDKSDNSLDEFSLPHSGTRIKGSIRIPENILMTFETPNIDIDHTIELTFQYSKTCMKSQVTLKASLVLTQGASNVSKLPLEHPLLTDEDDEDEDERSGILLMPLIKFKLEEKYNLLSKTAALMEDEDY